MIIDVIIPAFNEGLSIGAVLQEIPRAWVRTAIVCDNGSTDNTALVAASHGAIVVYEPQKGYGNACLKGIAYLMAKPVAERPDIVVFMDGDHSDYPEELVNLVQPILHEGVELVIGARTLGNLEPGAMQPQQIFGNWLATTLIRWLYGYHFTDLGPFRAIRFDTLMALNMQDKNFGWTVEMQVKAAKLKVKCLEVPVNYRKRIGVSKVSGTVKGTILAGYKIIWTIFKLLFTRH